jgi:hypothetical protein
MVKGSCLCGGVRYEIDGKIDPMAHCYCSMCRKQHGASFGTYVGVNASDFRWVQGEELLTRYQSSPGVQRGFCRTCGSGLPVPEPGAQQFFVPAGTLDDDPGARPAAHIFVGSKAPWVEIRDDLPQFDGYPPGFGPEGES